VDKVTIVKIACAIVGLGIFGYGVRSDESVVRWVGIGLVIVAFLLRFVRKRVPEDVE
jgi:hypothetical protein